MKRNGKIVSLILALLLVCASLAACGEDASDDPVVGTWELTKVSALGQEMSAKEFLKSANYEDKGTPAITFNGDYSVKVDMLGTKGEGKWELKDNKYHVTDDTSSTLDFTLENEILSIEQSGATLEFEKQAEK